MRFSRKLTAIIASLGVTAAGGAPAYAADKCDLIKAFASKEGKGLRKLSIGVTRDGTFDVLLNKKATVIRGAESCEIAGPLDSFELGCQWGFDADQTVAKHRLQAMKIGLSSCLADGWTQPVSFYTTERYRVVNEYEATLLDSDEEEVEIEINVTEFLREDGTPDYDLNIRLERY